MSLQVYRITKSNKIYFKVFNFYNILYIYYLHNQNVIIKKIKENQSQGRDIFPCQPDSFFPNLVILLATFNSFLECGQLRFKEIEVNKEEQVPALRKRRTN